MEDASEEPFDEIQIKTLVLRFVGNMQAFVCFGIFHFRKQMCSRAKNIYEVAVRLLLTTILVLGPL